jgi:hypothetical protein
VAAELPFILKVAGKDEVDVVRAVSTSFHFHGWLRLDGAVLRIEWKGHARVEEVELLSVRDEQLPLPAESLVVPLARLRRAELLGGWWRPRLAISARDLHALSVVPSEDQGVVSFWYARRDAALAADLAVQLQRGIAAALETGGSGAEIVHLSESTPARPVTPPPL